MKSVWNRRTDQMKKSETRRKKNREKEKLEKKRTRRNQFARLLWLSIQRRERQEWERHTCGLKVVVLGETTAILALVVVTTVVVVAEKKWDYRKIIIMEHTHTQRSLQCLCRTHTFENEHWLRYLAVFLPFLTSSASRSSYVSSPS